MISTLQCEAVGVQVSSRWLLRDVSLDLHRGEIVAFGGPNGAGKSTLLAVLAGDIPPATGRVLLDNLELDRYRPRDLALKRAVLPQQAIVQFAFTAREIVEMGRSPRQDARDEPLGVERAMHRTDTTALQQRVFPSLSVGEQARVSLARVLAQETPVVLLDEPTAALDLRHQQMVMHVARELASHGASIGVILHDLNLAAAFADRIVLLRDGMVAGCGAPWEVLNERLLEEVFECPIQVTRHPSLDCPWIVPIMTSTSGSLRSDGTPLTASKAPG